MTVPTATDERIYVLRSRWESYLSAGTFEHFIEFTVAVNSLAEYFNRLRLPGLVRLCESLENAALTRLGDPSSHPVEAAGRNELQKLVDALLGAVNASRPPVIERRREDRSDEAAGNDWIKPRSVWMVVSPEMQAMAQALRRQLDFYGFLCAARTCLHRWRPQAVPDQPVDLSRCDAGHRNDRHADARWH